MSEADEVGSIVAYLTLNRAEWIREVKATEGDVRRLGGLSPDIKIDTNAGSIIIQLAAVRRESDQVGSKSPNIRVSSNAKEQTAQMHLLLDSILLVSGAAFPIAGVLAGGAIGAVPVLAAVALAVKGISDAEKSGALQNSQYAGDVKSLQLWLAQLKTVAASGILNGADQAIQNSRPLFGLITSDIRDTSNQIGQIVAHDAPALLTIFTQLNPLFVTFGNVISRGAVELEHWSQSGKGATGFVAYVQANMPSVLNFLGNLITLVSHIAQASAGFGGGILTGLNLLIEGIDALPLDVLQVLIQLIIAARAAMLANQAVTAVVDSVSGSYAKLQAAQARQAAAAELSAKVNQQSALQVQAAAEEEAAQVALAKAQEAQAWAELVAAADSASGALIVASQNEARAAQEAADVAVAAAAETAAAAATMAAEIDAAGAEAAAGWSAALGPAAALLIGVTILSTAFFGNHDAAKAAAEAANSYATSVKESTDALSSANIAQTNDNLAKKGAISALEKVTAANKDLGISNVDLVEAVNGSKTKFDEVIATLEQVHDAGYKSVTVGKNVAGGYNAQANAAQNLIEVLRAQRKGLQDQILTQTQLNQINEATLGISDDQAQAGAKLFGLVGTQGVSAYLAAQQAAQKNTEQTKQQTIAWQLANDAASLLQQEIDKLSGTKLSYAQAENAFEQQLVNSGTALGTLSAATSKHTLAVEAERTAQQKYDNLVANPKSSSNSIASAKLALARAQAAVTSSTDKLSAAQQKNSMTLTGMSAAAVQNRGTLQSQISAAEQAADAYGKLNKSTEAGRQHLITLRQEIIDTAVAHGADRKAVTDYINTIMTIPAATTSASRTSAESIALLQAKIDAIKQHQIPEIRLGGDAAGQIAKLQAEIDALRGKTVHVSFTGAAAADQNSLPHKATGGRIYGPGNGTSDSVPIMASAGEEMMNAAATAKYGSIFDMLNRGVPLSALSIPGPQLPSRALAAVGAGGAGGGGLSGGATHKTVNLELHTHNPVPERASESLPDQMKRAENAIEDWV